MAIPSALEDRENGKFVESPTRPGETAAEVTLAGVATSAKQDLLLTELQLKADLTEVQPISLNVPTSIAAGAFNVATAGTRQQLPLMLPSL